MKKIALLICLLTAGAARAQDFRLRGPSLFNGYTPSVTLSGSAPQMQCTAATATCQFLSATNDATTTTSVSAFDFKLGNNIDNGDIGWSFSNSAGTKVAYIYENGDLAVSGTISAPAFNFAVNGSGVTTGRINGLNPDPIILKGNMADGATAVGVAVDTPAYSTSGAKLFSVRNNTSEKASIDKDGTLTLSGGLGTGAVDVGFGKDLYIAGRLFSSTGNQPVRLLGGSSAANLVSFRTGTDAEAAGITREGGIKLNVQSGARPTCNSAARGTIHYSPGGAGVADALEVCRKDAADAYAWVALY